MRKLSERCREQIAALHKPAGLAERLFHRSSWNLDAIEQIAQGGEPAAIPYLLPILFSSDKRAFVAVTQAIGLLLSKIAVADLPWLDDAMRHYSYDYGLSSVWHKIHPRELAKWVGPGEAGTFLLQLASLHPNGYVREEAVRRLSLVHDGSELSYLLLRLNDWVAPVRRLSQSAILDRIRPEYADRFIQNLALIVRLQEMRRNDMRVVLEEVAQLLLSPAVHQKMVSLMNSDSRILRRASFDVLKTAEPPALPEIFRAALDVKDHVIRLHATRAIVDILDHDELRPILLALFKDTASSVRLEALRGLVTKSTGMPTEQLIQGLLDSNASVRNEARYWLGKNASIDFRQFYLDALMLEGLHALMPAIIGLSEVGMAEDANTLTPFLEHSRVAVRKTVVKHLMKLGGEQYFDCIFDRVLDNSPGVSNLAREVVERFSYRLDAARVWEQFTTTKFPHVQKNMLHLIAGFPKWESLIFLLRAVHEGNESIGMLALNYLNIWDRQYNRSQVTPAPQQIKQVTVALKEVEAKLPVAVVDSIKFAIRSYCAG